jgi:hypothetical protein
MELFPHSLGWVERSAQRSAVKRGIGENYIPQ